MESSNGDNKQSTATSEAAASKMKLQIRTARIQKYVDIDETTTIKDLRQKTAELFEVDDPALTVLIFGGKILKDTEDIKTHGIKDGQTIHLVIRNKSSGSSASSAMSTNQQTNQLTSNTTTTTANNPLNSNPIDNTNNNPNSRGQDPLNPSMMTDVQQRLQQLLISNPDTMQNMIQSPMMQQMLTNPGMIRSLFGSMQRMQLLMERNPEVNHLLSNPDVLRESLEMVRNPAALQEVMRNYDRALNNMESMPGGYNVLRRMYTEFQEPLLSAFQEQLNGNQFASPQSNQGGGANDSDRPSSDSNEQQRIENRDPLPNPWAAPAQNTRPSFPAAGLMGAAAGNLDNTAGGAGGNMNSADLLQRANSMFQDQEFMSLLTNPEAIQSVEQIQQGLERLQRIAPNMFGRMGIPTLPRGNLGTNNDANQPSRDGLGDLGNNADAIGRLMQQFMEQAQGGARGGANPNSDGSNTTTNRGSDSAPPMPNEQQSAEATRMLMQLLSGGAQGAGLGAGLGGLAEGGQQRANAGGQRPEDQYSQQLQQMSEMGFTNREANLRALIATFGDINAAIARLLPQ